jgi:restriction endonuclease S subunit
MKDNWIETTLGEMVDIQKGKKPPVLVDNANSGDPYLTADVLRGGAPSQFVPPSALAACIQLQGDETVLLWDGAGAGDVFRSSVGVLASTMAKLTARPIDTISAEYLYLVAVKTSPDIKSSCRGTTVPHVSPAALSDLAITLPPLSEQKRIVDVMSSVDAYITALQHQAAEARTARNAVLHELLTTGGDDWTVSKLGDVVEKIGMGPFGSNIKISTFVPQGIPVISGAHLGKDKLTEQSFNFITTEHADRISGSNVYRGDLVLTHAGTVGQVSVVPENSKFGRYVVSQRGFYIRPATAIISAEYLLLFLKYGEGHEQLMSNINRTGVPSLSQPVTFVRNMPVRFPSPARQ